MIRGGSRSGRIALLVCVSAALAAAPATAGAQSAQEEYQLDIPGGGSGSNPASPGGTPPAATAAGTGSGSTETGTGTATGTDTGTGAGTGSGSDAAGNHAGDKTKAEQRKADEDLALGETHAGEAEALDTSSRSAPEVVADTVLDSAMLPILAALVLITGVGAWRVLRGRRTLSGQAG
jgi:hypothetical protein